MKVDHACGFVGCGKIAGTVHFACTQLTRRSSPGRGTYAPDQFRLDSLLAIRVDCTAPAANTSGVLAGSGSGRGLISSAQLAWATASSLGGGGGSPRASSWLSVRVVGSSVASNSAKVTFTPRLVKILRSIICMSELSVSGLKTSKP